MNNLHIFLGATVADAATRPLHWVYDPKKLKKYIKGKKDITFMKKNKSPFYSIKTGNVSGYNDVGQVMFKTLISTKKKSDILKNFKKNIIKNFGPGSAYWKNLKLRKRYKKIKWKGPMNGPWIHQNILETIQNIKSRKNATGGTKVNESDGYCAALPYYLYNDSEKELKKVIKSVANSKINETYALAKLKIINFANDGDKNAVNSFVKKYGKNRYFTEAVNNIKKVIKSVANSKINETYALAKLKIINFANNGDENAVHSFVKKYGKNRYFREVVNNIKKVIRLY